MRTQVVPAPTPEDAAALAAAIEAALAEERLGARGAGLPAAYRSAWRQAAIRESVHSPGDPGDEPR